MSSRRIRDGTQARLGYDTQGGTIRSIPLPLLSMSLNPADIMGGLKRPLFSTKDVWNDLKESERVGHRMNHKLHTDWYMGYDIRTGRVSESGGCGGGFQEYVEDIKSLDYSDAAVGDDPLEVYDTYNLSGEILAEWARRRYLYMKYGDHSKYKWEDVRQHLDVVNEDAPPDFLTETAKTNWRIWRAKWKNPDRRFRPSVTDVYDRTRPAEWHELYYRLGDGPMQDQAADSDSDKDSQTTVMDGYSRVVDTDSDSGENSQTNNESDSQTTVLSSDEDTICSHSPDYNEYSSGVAEKLEDMNHGVRCRVCSQRWFVWGNRSNGFNAGWFDAGGCDTTAKCYGSKTPIHA